MVRRVHRRGREIEEVGLAGRRRPHPLDPGDGLVHQVLGEVVVGLAEIGEDRRRLVVDGGLVLRGLGVDDAVEPLEAHARRPAVEGAGGPLLPGGGQVPLAEATGGVAVLPQDLGHRGRGAGDEAVIAGEAVGPLGNAAHVHGVVVAPGEQGRPGGRAQGRGVELVVAQALCRHGVQGRGRHGPAECAEGPEAHIVQHDEDDVRGALRSTVLAQARRLGRIQQPLDPAFEGPGGFRKFRHAPAPTRVLPIPWPDRANSRASP